MLMMERDQKVWTCSGFLLAPDLFITNWHCGGIRDETPDQAFWDEDMLRSALIDFSWDEDDVSREFACDGKVIENEELDYALLPIVPLTGDRALKPATIERERPDQSKDVIVIHHPNALPKQISKDCETEALSRPSWRGGIAGSDFEHVCDTEGGSSGAPVFNKAGHLIGLHHHGFDLDPNTCRPTDKVNKAIWIDAILDDLETRGISLQTPR
jgi:hypothetical protein